VGGVWGGGLRPTLLERGEKRVAALFVCTGSAWSTYELWIAKPSLSLSLARDLFVALIFSLVHSLVFFLFSCLSVLFVHLCLLCLYVPLIVTSSLFKARSCL